MEFLYLYQIFVEDFVTILRPRKGQCPVTMVAIEASHHLAAADTPSDPENVKPPKIFR
jgi:hypothetical protein